MTDGLHTLASHGFQFAHPHDGHGRLIAVVGIRVHHEVIDIVQLYGDHDAEAARISGEEPDILFPRTVLWHTTGTAQEVIDAAIATAQRKRSRKPANSPDTSLTPTTHHAMNRDGASMPARSPVDTASWYD